MMDFKELFDWLEKRWKNPIGLILTLITVCCVLNHPLRSTADVSIVSAALFLACACAEVIVFWLINTVRAFQRTRYYTLIWVLLLFSIPIIFTAVIHPYLIENSKYDIVGIQYWGAGLLFVLLIVLFYFILFKWNKNKNGIQIVFLVGNESDADRQIQETLNEACCRIEEKCDAVKLRVAPFGIVKNKKTAERYATSYLCQADAVVYSRIMEGEEDGSCGYVFTEFCSFINTHRLTNDDERITDIDNLLSGESKYKSWNLRNRNKNDIADKLKVAHSIEQLLRLYCTCIYILKHRLSTAIDMAHSLYNHENNPNSRLKILSQNLLEFAYLEAEAVEEQEHQDYNYALTLLEKLKTEVPFISRTLSFSLAMARVLFYLGRIPESKHFTKQVKTEDPWGYSVNMGFYAMYEGKIHEFVSHYKRLTKCPIPTKEQVEFVIKFLECQVSLTNEHRFKALLLSAIAYQTQYLDMKKAKRGIRCIINDYPFVCENKDLNKMLNSIYEDANILRTRN